MQAIWGDPNSLLDLEFCDHNKTTEPIHLSLAHASGVFTSTFCIIVHDDVDTSW